MLRAVQSGLLAASVVMIFAVVAEAAQAASWKIQSTPNPSGYSVLEGVSCGAARACIAVGQYYGRLGYTTLAERWNGSSWKLHSGAEGGSNLAGVSCSAASACTAVGSHTNSDGNGATLAERWNGSSWTIESSPNPGEGGELLGVSCSSASACTAVGDYYNSDGNGATLAERWNGSSWKKERTPNPPGEADYPSLLGVSCSSASACTAVGSYTKSDGNGVTLAERWNGKSWERESTVNPSGAKDIELDGVSCSAASACTAVGSYYNSAANGVTLAERWNGKSWKVQSTPQPRNPLSGSGFLVGVSCPSARACTAAGTARATLAEGWNGKSWKKERTPNPTRAKDIELSAVSCSSASACTAIGFYRKKSGLYVPLVERYS